MTTTAQDVWTYESLAATDRKTLENLLRTGTPPDPEELEGWIYCGWNHEWLPQRLSGEKFKKVVPQEGRQAVRLTTRSSARTTRGPAASGRSSCTRAGRGRSATSASATSRTSRRRSSTASIRTRASSTTRCARNTWLNLPFRVIRDYSVLANPGDPGLILCKAYFQLLHPRFNIFYCYFLLGRREPIEFEPEYVR